MIGDAVDAARIAKTAADHLLQVERLCDGLFDDRLESDIDMARLSTLSIIHRLEQIILAGGEPELEALIS